MSEVDTKCAIAMVYDLSSDQQIELDCLDVGVEVTPAKHLFELACFNDGSPLGPGTSNVKVGGVVEPVPKCLFGVGF